MTRFDYFDDIEETFVRLRGKALILSPLDWQLIQQWKDDGVPLHIVISAIEEVFEKHKARKSRRPIASLSYCKSEVEARFAEWKESRVGAHESEPRAVATGSPDNSSPFPKEAVLAHLERKREELIRLGTAPAKAPQGFIVGLVHVVGKLEALRTGLQVAERIDVRLLEVGLTELERILDLAIEAVATPEQIAGARAAAEATFSPYKANMPEKVYEQQIDTALKKRLREAFGVPRLSLFHMK
jgi:hypothetical protein